MDSVVEEPFTLVYCHRADSQRGEPSQFVTPPYNLLIQAFSIFDRRYSKNLRNLFVCHPTKWVKAFFLLMTPVIKSKFWRKFHYIENIHDLHGHIAPAQLNLPASVLEFNAWVHDKDGIAPPKGGYT